MGQFIDLTGQKFNRWTVIKEYGRNKYGYVTWLCKCECGNEKILPGTYLTRSGTNSCGCYKKEIISKKKTENLKGKRFGKLIVLTRNGNNKSGSVLWLCKCDCGKLTIVTSGNLKIGHTRSCGCLLNENCGEKNGNFKHGAYRKKIYNIWRSIKQRCYNKKCDKYKYYGARGIGMCDEWRNNFQVFYDYMKDCPEKMSIDRINNNGNYEPGNCRWATQKEQSMNKRTNLVFKINNIEKCLSEWCEIYKINYTYALCKIKSGWKIEKILGIG